MKTASFALLVTILGAALRGGEEPKILSVATRPTQHDLSAAGLRFESLLARYPAKHAPTPPPEGQGFIWALKDVDLLLRVSEQASLRGSFAQILVYFPADELERPTPKDFPRIRDGSRVGWLHLEFSGPLEERREPLIRFLRDLGAESTDLEAWLAHKMWRSTGRFERVYRAAPPQIQIGLDVKEKEGIPTLEGVLSVDWVNDLDGAWKARWAH